jgi:hypothetical protein
MAPRDTPGDRPGDTSGGGETAGAALTAAALETADRAALVAALRESLAAIPASSALDDATLREIAAACFAGADGALWGSELYGRIHNRHAPKALWNPYWTVAQTITLQTRPRLEILRSTLTEMRARGGWVKRAAGAAPTAATTGHATPRPAYAAADCSAQVLGDGQPAGQSVKPDAKRGAEPEWPPPEPPKDGDAGLLLDWLLHRRPPVKPRHILRTGPREVRTPARRDAAIAMLVQHHCIRVRPGARGTATLLVNPKLA